MECPSPAAIGGGYEQNHADIVRRHMHLHRAAAEHMAGFAALLDARRQAAMTARARQQVAVGIAT